MKIIYYTHKPEEPKSRNISVGQKVVGVRLLSLEITNQQELHQLLSEDGIKWAQKHLKFRMVPIDNNRS